MRGEIKSTIGRTGLAAVVAQRERVAVEVMKLAKNHYDELLRGTGTP